MIEREASVYHGREQSEFFEALRSCVDFARSQGLKIGPGRGYASSSLILFALGVTDIDPVIEQLVPERMSLVPPEIHIDVEFGRGQVFVDYCRKISDGLTWGSIHAFKMPLIDIINNVRARVGLTWESLRVSDDDHAVLSLIGRGDIDKIFLLDYSPNALIMKYENFLPDFVDGEKLKNYLTSQKIHSLRDVFNIIALWHPKSSEKIARLERYKQAKEERSHYSFLSAEQKAVLEPNFGVVIYHEDIIRLIELATGWDIGRCASLRRALFLRQETPDLDELRRIAKPEFVSLLCEEAPYAFCKSHTHAHCRFTEATAFLKTRYREEYLAEVARWENEHGLMYDDIGVRFNCVSLLQN
jgi:DNA polymerase III alpha subunit